MKKTLLYSILCFLSMSFTMVPIQPPAIWLGAHALSAMTFLALTKTAANVNVVLRNTQPLIFLTPAHGDVAPLCTNILKDLNITQNIAIEEGNDACQLHYQFPMEKQEDFLKIVLHGYDSKELTPIIYHSEKAADRLIDGQLSPDDSIELKVQAGYIANNYLKALTSFYTYSPLIIQAISSALWLGYGMNSLGTAGKCCALLAGLPTKLFIYALSLGAFSHYQKIKACKFGLGHATHSEIEAFIANYDQQIIQAQKEPSIQNSTLSFLYTAHLQQLKNLGQQYLNRKLSQQ